MKIYTGFRDVVVVRSDNTLDPRYSIRCLAFNYDGYDLSIVPYLDRSTFVFIGSDKYRKDIL